MNRQLLAAFTALSLLSSGAIAQTAAPQGQVEIGRGENREAELASHVTDAEQFIGIAGVGNLFEIQSSQTALEKAQSADIKAFAQMMITDHTQANEQLAAVIQQADISVVPPNGIDAASAEKMEDIQTVTTDQFDRKYLRWQIQTHQASVALFTSYAQGGDNEQLKQFAAEMLPKLQAHLTRAVELNATFGPGE